MSQEQIEVETCNVVLLDGPVGGGKTAAVYASASELGFKVIEVHPGMLRSSKQIFSSFSEATQSHELGKWCAWILVELPAAGLSPGV